LAAVVFDQSLEGTVGPGVLFVHGQGSSQKGYEHRARVISRALDAVCLTFDLSGHGSDADNFDRYSTKDHLQDVVAAYDYLVSRNHVDRARVGVCGASYGGYLAALLTFHRAVTRLVLRAPSLPSSTDPTTMSHRAPHASEAPTQFDSIYALRRFEGETLVIESEKDEVIPKSHIAAYLGTSSKVQHLVIPEATHALTNPRWDDVFVSAILSWFQIL
jgi:uncharacterized protein